MAAKPKPKKKKEPRRVSQEELAAMHYDPVEKVYYDTSELVKRGMEVPEWAGGGGDKKSKDFSPTHELSESGRIVPIGGEPDSYDPAVARGGGEFYAPPEGDPVWQEKDDDGNVTYTEYAPGSEARKVRFESRAALKQELERRRVQGEFPRGRGGLYGLVPYAEYEAEQRTEQEERAKKQLEGKLEELGIARKGDATYVDDEGNIHPQLEVPRETIGTTSDEPVKVKEDVTGEIKETERLKRDEGAQAEGRAETIDTSRRATPATKQAESRPPEDKPESPQLAVGDVVEERDFDPLDKELTAEEREKIEAGLAELDDKVGPLEEAMKAVEEEPDIITVGDEGEEITLRGLTPSQEIPEPTEDPDLTDVELAEEPPEPPMEAAAEDPATETRPVVDKPEAADIDTSDLQLEEEGAISAAEIEDLAADVPGGFEYLKNAFREFNRSGYRPGNVFDRRRMEFLIDFLNKADYPQDPEELKLVAQKAFERLQTQLSESTEAAGQRLKANIGKE